MTRSTNRLLLLVALLVCTLALSSCAAKNPIPAAGTRAKATSELFRQTSRGLADHCARIGGCTCFIDGLQTTCSLVFACLDAGFCELER
jgi:hypothetical protein